MRKNAVQEPDDLSARVRALDAQIADLRDRSDLQALPFIKQFIHNHLITLDGDSATGLSYLDARTARDGESILVAARFDDVYRRCGGEWRFKSLRLSVAFAVPIQEGWAAHVTP